MSRAGMHWGSWCWYGNNEVPSSERMSLGFRSWLLNRGVGWSDGSGVVSSASPRVGLRVGDLIDWLPDWGDSAESEWSVSQTAAGREDCTQGMMGNKWLWGGRLRADGDWQPARSVQFFLRLCFWCCVCLWCFKKRREESGEFVLNVFLNHNWFCVRL